MEILKRLVREEEGQTLTEYGLVIAIVAIAVIGVLGVLSGNLQKVFTKIADALKVDEGAAS